MPIVTVKVRPSSTEWHWFGNIREMAMRQHSPAEPKRTVDARRRPAAVGDGLAAPLATFSQSKSLAWSWKTCCELNEASPGP